MPIPIKIQCDCGQRYAFDVETASNLSPNSVVCPVCGADGTAAANSVIMQNLASAPAAPVAPPQSSGLRLSVSAASTPTVRSTSRIASQMLHVDPEKARAEARSKMMWGDPPETVISFLRMQGFNKEEATAMVQELVRERKSAVRGIGVRKIVTGILLMAIPLIALIIFISVGVILMKLMAVAVMIGLWGLWRLVNGIIMFLAPKSQPGDLADQ